MTATPSPPADASTIPSPAEVARWLERSYRMGSAEVKFVRHGENTTFRVRGDSGDYALRLHRPGYQSRESIASELAWTAALRRDGVVVTPAAIPGRDGALIQEGAMGAPAVLFEWLQGRPLGELDRPELWRRFGELTACLHEHAGRWKLPPGFTRPAWDVDSLAGSKPRWGDPLTLASWAEPDARLIADARGEVRRRLRAFGTDPGRFGLIHADLAFENVLVGVDEGTIVLDFDDGGFGWFAYDLAVSLSAHEGSRGFDWRREALVRGYRRVRALDSAVLAELPTFLMARRLASLGWTFSRAETTHARRLRSARIAAAPRRALAYLEWADARL